MDFYNLDLQKGGQYMDTSTGSMGGFYTLANWIMRLAYVNILWIVFSFVGIIILGFFPATTGMFSVIRKWVQGDSDIPIFTTFWDSYKKEFLKSNLLGLILSLIGYIIYIDFVFLRQGVDGFLQFTYYPLLIVILLYFLVLLYVFPVFVHYEINIFQVIKNAFLLMIMSPLITIMMIVGLVISFYVMRALPGLTPFFTGSILAYVIYWSVNFAFAKVERYKGLNSDTNLKEQNEK